MALQSGRRTRQNKGVRLHRDSSTSDKFTHAAIAAACLLSAFFASTATATTAVEENTKTESGKVAQSAIYRSPTDEQLTIRRLSVLPGADNTDGIYARPIENQIVELVKASHRWEYSDPGLASLPKAPLEIEENPEISKSMLKNIDTDAVILPVITRGPSGLSIRLSLILKTDGRVLAQEVVRDHQRYEMRDVKDVATRMYKKLVDKIPYDGLVLSRQGTRVTVNLGTNDGIKLEQTVAVVQIIAINRHPKFGFLISTEKEILGQVKILKIDDTLSFGVITAEKERGAIRPMAKIAGVRPVDYGEQTFNPSNSSGDINSRPDANVAFGDAAKEWLPIRQPSFGQVGIKASVGSYAGSTNVAGVGSLDAKSDFYPMLGVSGELWLNPQWTVMADITQGIITTANPRGNSSPSTLNHALSKYSMSIGYNFLIRDNFFGPKFQLKTGIQFYRMFVDDSTPQAFTTVNYNGYILGLGLYFPLSDDSPWALGGDFQMLLFSSLTESPTTSGSSANNTINEFSLFAERKIAVNLRLRGSADFSLYSSSLTGAGTRTERASSISQRHLSLGAGLIYQF